MSHNGAPQMVAQDLKDKKLKREIENTGQTETAFQHRCGPLHFVLWDKQNVLLQIYKCC